MMSGECQASEPIPDWFGHIKDGRLGSGDVHMCSTDPTHPPQWVVCLPGGKTTPRDASQSSTATVVNVYAGKVEQLLPSMRVCSNFA